MVHNELAKLAWSSRRNRQVPILDRSLAHRWALYRPLGPKLATFPSLAHTAPGCRWCRGREHAGEKPGVFLPYDAGQVEVLQFVAWSEILDGRRQNMGWTMNACNCDDPVNGALVEAIVAGLSSIQIRDRPGIQWGWDGISNWRIIIGMMGK